MSRMRHPAHVQMRAPSHLGRSRSSDGPDQPADEAVGTAGVGEAITAQAHPVPSAPEVTLGLDSDRAASACSANLPPRVAADAVPPVLTDGNPTDGWRRLLDVGPQIRRRSVPPRRVGVHRSPKHSAQALVHAIGPPAPVRPSPGGC